MRHTLTRGAIVAALAAIGLAVAVALAMAGHASGSTTPSPTTGAIVPAVSDYQQISASETPPTQAQCASPAAAASTRTRRGRRTTSAA